jgi:hypothetical protein
LLRGRSVSVVFDTFSCKYAYTERQESGEFEIKLCGMCRLPQQAAIHASTRDRVPQALTVPYCVVVCYGCALCIVFCRAGRDLKMKHRVSVRFFLKLRNNPAETLSVEITALLGCYAALIGSTVRD